MDFGVLWASMIADRPFYQVSFRDDTNTGFIFGNDKAADFLLFIEHTGVKDRCVSIDGDYFP